MMRVTCAASTAVSARPGGARAGGPGWPSGRPADLARPADPPRPVDPSRPAGKAEALLYGVVRFEGDRNDPRNVVLAFESARAADEYATRHGFGDYLVVPLSFLAPPAAV